MGALKRGLNPRARELGIYVCGGRGRYSRNTPGELRVIGERTGLDGEKLAQTSRLVARVDNNAIADGFQLYLHSFILSRHGRVGGRAAGNERNQRAGRGATTGIRPRCATLPTNLHTGIVGRHQGVIMNLVDCQARPAQHAMLEVARERPETTLREARGRMSRRAACCCPLATMSTPKIQSPATRRGYFRCL